VDAEAARKLVADHIVSDDALLTFLDGFKNRQHSHGLFERTVSVSIRFDPIRLWAWVEDVDEIERRLKGMNATALSAEQKPLVAAFLAGCAARRSGHDPKWTDAPEDR
jgi:hypothetical protein